MSGFRFRRAPDPSKPGTIYRSKPKIGRNRGLSSGPPYLDGTTRPPVSRAAVTPAAGVGSVYQEHGGGPDDSAGYGRTFDDPGYDSPEGPANGFSRSGRGQGGAYGPSGRTAGDPYGRSRGPGSAPGRGPGSAPGRGPGEPPAGGGFAFPKLRVPRLRLIILALVLVLIGYPVLLGATALTSLNRVDALAPAHKIADTKDTPGRTYLVVGSD
jgi:hypothetical protein